jgi:hypothetical protein
VLRLKFLCRLRAFGGAEKQPMDRLKADVAQVRGKVAEMDVKVEVR